MAPSRKGTFAPVAIILILVSSSSVSAETATGFPYLSDADTVIIHGTKIRLAGIDAPEMGQTCFDRAGKPYRCGEAAREALTAAYAGKEWQCELQTRPDRYRRRVGVCTVSWAENSAQQISINRWLVRSGWAFDYPRYSHGMYAADEVAARVGRCGLWAGRFEMPWAWKHRVTSPQ